MASFRPWTRNVSALPAKARVVVLFDSGNVDISAWKFRLRPNLPADDVPGIDRIVKQTRTYFSLNASSGRSYELNFWQPFVVEWDPSRVYIVRRVGSHDYRVVSTSVDDAARNGSRLPKWVLPYG